MTATFSSLSEFSALLKQLPKANENAKTAAMARNEQLTKPQGSLGQLEEIALWLASWQGVERPTVNTPHVTVFAGNHGVTAQGVSAFPVEVTQQMVLNFEHGGAAINQLTKVFGAKLNVIALELENPTMDFTQMPAMSEKECVDALMIGWNAVDPACDVFITGEMGIGNTTSAAAIAYALWGGEGRDWVGRGTGVDDAGVLHKAQVIEAALSENPHARENGLQALRSFGGRELAAMAGAIAAARYHSIPVILDGFICCAAAACLEMDTTGALDHAIAGHVSAESAHSKILRNLGKEALISLDMRLGEASGAAVALGIVKAAAACHSGMATFQEAGVSSE